MEISLEKKDIKDIQIILDNFVGLYSSLVDFPALAWALQTLLDAADEVKAYLNEEKEEYEDE